MTGDRGSGIDTPMSPSSNRSRVGERYAWRDGVGDRGWSERDISLKLSSIDCLEWEDRGVEGPAYTS